MFLSRQDLVADDQDGGGDDLGTGVHEHLGRAASAHLAPRRPLLKPAGADVRPVVPTQPPKK
jgi:hypothetical protein